MRQDVLMQRAEAVGDPYVGRQALCRAHLLQLMALSRSEPLAVGRLLCEHPEEVAAELSRRGDGG